MEKKETTPRNAVDNVGDKPIRMAPVFLCISLFGLLVRSVVSIHPYSGAGDPPKYGDYEAQRHWMEITLNLPVKEWYHNGTNNDLRYWGLDYPPLTAYQSYLHGIFVRFFLPDSVSLFTSRGHESYLGKLLMRWTVLSSDLLIFFPAVLYFVLVYYGGRAGRSDVAWHFALMLINPCPILIDHGHFQYNCISLGLVVAAVAAVLSQKDLMGSMLFCLSLNHKQDCLGSLALGRILLPFIVNRQVVWEMMWEIPVPYCEETHLLGKSLRRNNPLLEVLKLGLVVFGTFAAVWWPYLHSRDDFMQVLSRLAPFERGIYEDYVANFWCTTSVLIKWKKLFTIQSLRLISLAATVLTCLPSMVQQILTPSSKGFLYGLLNSALSFYLFSFQVHEKSILLPLLPATLMALEWPRPFSLFMHYAMFSMFPLLCRDKLILPYVALYALFILLYLAPGGKRDTKTHHSATVTSLSILMTFLYLCSLVLHVLYLTVRPPEKYPFLFEAVIMLLCFFHFSLFAVYTNAKQWMLSRQLTSKGKEQKQE